MIRKLLLSICFTFLIVSSVYANPLIYAEPWDNVTEFYRLTVNGVELEEDIPAQEIYNWVFFFDIEDLYLSDGVHEIWIRSCNEQKEGSDFKFLLIIKKFKTFRQYELKMDRRNNKDDPLYKTRFDEPLILKIPIK